MTLKLIILLTKEYICTFSVLIHQCGPIVISISSRSELRIYHFLDLISNWSNLYRTSLSATPIPNNLNSNLCYHFHFHRIIQ